MRYYNLLQALFLIITSLASSAWAVTASDLEQISSSARCRTEAMSLKPLYDRRDEGMSREEALAIVDKANGSPISRRAVQIAFDFPRMPRDGTTVYILWSCHALEHYVVVRPLSDYPAEFQECYAKAAWQREACATVLWNRIHGFPDDRRSRAKQVTVVAPVAPASKPSAESQPEAPR